MVWLAFYGCEAGIFLALVSLYQASTMPDIWSFLRSNPGGAFVASSIIIVFCVGWAIHIMRKCTPTNKRTMYLWLRMNLVTLVLILGSAEILARYLANPSTVLNWPQVVARNTKLIDRMAHEGTYMVHDQILGWTMTPSGSDQAGLYFGSREGLRSPRRGMSFADLRTRHSNDSAEPASVRIALIGNSFTFGHEVRCEESWGHKLEAQLQPHSQVLNFAVPAYGLDQIWLRYWKDVRLWKPQIVVIGIYSDVIKRINSIYPFIQTPQWDFPFVRPLLNMQDHPPTVINYPVPDPEQIFVSTAISEVPDIDLDVYYRPFQWQRGGMWYLFEKSSFFRHANAWWHLGDDSDEERTQNALQTGQLLIRNLVHEIKEDGSLPLVVYLPNKVELRLSTEPQSTYIPLSARMLRNAGIEYFDPTNCLSRVEASHAFMRGGHYSPQANSQIAHCLEPVLRGMVGGLRR